jgi:hypothetical protein
MVAIHSDKQVLLPPENAEHFSGLKHVMAKID